MQPRLKRIQAPEARLACGGVVNYQPGPELQVLAGAEHFFHGRLIDLREAVTSFVKAAEAGRAQKKPG